MMRLNAAFLVTQEVAAGRLRIVRVVVGAGRAGLDALGTGSAPVAGDFAATTFGAYNGVSSPLARRAALAGLGAHHEG